LPTRQQSVLNAIEHALAARDPDLAYMFAVFTLLTRDAGPPRTERLLRDPNPVPVMLRAAARQARASAAIPIALVAGLMAVIIALGIATSGGPACRSAASARHPAQSRSDFCRSTANDRPK
jgi:predicted metal-binding membrane protein